MRRKMRKIRMQLPPEALDELSHLAFDVGHQRVTRVQHIRVEIITLLSGKSLVAAAGIELEPFRGRERSGSPRSLP